MIRIRLSVCLCAMAASLAAPAANGAIQLSLSSSQDLFALTVGQPVHVDVSLTGLNPGETIDFLAATIGFDPLLWGLPTISAGPIVPDVTGFVGASLPGTADGSYDVLFAASGLPIDDNGIFFSFDVVAAAEGLGSINFDFVDSDAHAATGAPLDPVLSGGGLEYQISGSTNPGIVPEASSLVAWGGLIAATAVGVANGRRRARSAAAPVATLRN